MSWLVPPSRHVEEEGGIARTEMVRKAAAVTQHHKSTPQCNRAKLVAMEVPCVCRSSFQLINAALVDSNYSFSHMHLTALQQTYKQQTYLDNTDYTFNVIAVICANLQP